MKIHLEKNKKAGLLIWGIVLVLAAVCLILDSVGVFAGVDPSWTAWWRIVLGLLIVAWLISLCVEMKFTDIFFPLAFLFMIFEAPIAVAAGHADGELINNWIILLAALLLTFGFKAIFSKHSAIRFGKNDGTSAVSGKRGNSTVYLDASDLESAKISDNLGRVEVFFTGKEKYNGAGMVTVSDNLGVICLHIPKEWDVVTQTADNLGSVSIPQKDEPGEKNLTLVVRDNLGKIEVVYE